MGRYSEYFKDIWKLQANRKVLGLSIFGVLVDNSKPFTPGDQLMPFPDVDHAIRVLVQKGFDFVLITGQPQKRTRALDQKDFENIINGAGEFITQIGGRVRNVYYAPGTDKSDPYVKPNPGMLERAQNENNFKWEETYFVGSEPNDAKMAAKVKAAPVLIKSANSAEPKLKAFELTHQVKVQEFDSLLDFANSLK